MTDSERVQPHRNAGFELVGEHASRFDADDLGELPFRRRSVEIVCSSGSRHVSAWGGVPIADLLASGEVPLKTTHLVIESSDGFTACVGVDAAAEGLLAWSRDGSPLGEDHPYANRFVSPAVDGAKTIKGVERLQAIALSPNEEPEDYESLSTESPEMNE